MIIGIMPQCYGVTKSGSRCSYHARYTINIARADFPVCKKHQAPNLLSKWDKEIKRNGPRDPPDEIIGWLNNFYEAWNNTHNIAVSTRFASETFNLGSSTHLDKYDTKWDIYINTLLSKQGCSEPCSICFEDDNTFTTAECRHPVCVGCMKQWMSRAVTCPVCRTFL